MMTTLDFTIDLIGTVSGWIAVILGLAWAGRHFVKRETHIYLPPVGGDDDDDDGDRGGYNPRGAPPVLRARHTKKRKK